MVLELWPVWRSGKIHSIQTNYANRPGRPGEPYKRCRNGLARRGACQSLDQDLCRRTGQSCTRTGRIDAGVLVPECVRPIHTRILPEAKKSLFLDVIESCYELDFTRKQTAKNGGFVYREFLNRRGVLLNFWTIQRVKHKRIVSKTCGSRLIVKLWVIICAS